VSESKPNADARRVGHGEKCFVCLGLCDALVGDEGRWPVLLRRPDDPTEFRYYHTACIEKRMQERDSSMVMLEAYMGMYKKTLEALEAVEKERDGLKRQIEDLEGSVPVRKKLERVEADLFVLRREAKAVVQWREKSLKPNAGSFEKDSFSASIDALKNALAGTSFPEEGLLYAYRVLARAVLGLLEKLPSFLQSEKEHVRALVRVIEEKHGGTLP